MQSSCSRSFHFLFCTHTCSSRLINEDGEYALYTVTLFRRVVDAFNTAARENSFQVREFSLDAEAVQAKIAERNDLERDIKERRTSMYQWCQTSYGEVFGAWVHVCAIRLFVESILRYGLPPSFQACVMKPQKRSEKNYAASWPTLLGRARVLIGATVMTIRARRHSRTFLSALKSKD